MERERARKKKKHPALAGEMGFISMCSYSVMVTACFSLSLSLKRCNRQGSSAAERRRISVLASPQSTARTHRITAGLNKTAAAAAAAATENIVTVRKRLTDLNKGES